MPTKSNNLASSKVYRIFFISIYTLIIGLSLHSLLIEKENVDTFIPTMLMVGQLGLFVKSGGSLWPIRLVTAELGLLFFIKYLVGFSSVSSLLVVLILVILTLLPQKWLSRLMTW